MKQIKWKQDKRTKRWYSANLPIPNGNMWRYFISQIADRFEFCVNRTEDGIGSWEYFKTLEEAKDYGKEHIKLFA